MAGVGIFRKLVELGALRKESDSSAVLGDVVIDGAVLINGDVSLLDDDELALVVRNLLVTGYICLRAKIDVRLRESSKTHTGSAVARVKASGGDDIGTVVGVEGQAEGGGRSRTIGDDGRPAVADVLHSAVLVEDAARGRAHSNEVLGSAYMDRSDVLVVDGGVEVGRRVSDVDDKMEALRSGSGRIVGDDLAQAQRAGGGESCSHEANGEGGRNHGESGVCEADWWLVIEGLEVEIEIEVRTYE